jgi:DNA-binding transcriptional regulator YiaG
MDQDAVMKRKRETPRRKEMKAKVNEMPGVYGAAFATKNLPSVQQMAEKFGLRQEVLSRMTGFSLRAVAGWANGKEPSAPVRRAFTEMDRLLDGLARLMKPEEVGRWLKEPNPAFDGSTPVQVIERGQIDRVWRMLYFVESGEPG